MTHGAGAVSSGGGGGGGFSGGGFSAGYSTPLYHGGRRRRGSSNSDGDVCCCLCIMVGYLIGFLLCLTSMKPRTRVALVWFYCILIACLGGGLLSHRYRNQDISASPMDMREVSGISSVFCQSLSLVSTVSMPTYIFDQEPVVNTTYFANYDYTVGTTISRDHYEYWGFYLLLDSRVTISICAKQSHLELYIIKGKDNLNAWIDDPYNSDCYERSVIIYNCAISTQNVVMTASDSDDYFFLFINKNPYVMPATEVDLTFMLKRTRYDLSKGTLICYDEMDCEIPLIMNSGQHYIFDVPRGSPRDVDVTIICEARVYFYIIIFGLLPVLGGVFTSVVILKWAQRKQQRTRNRSDSQVFSISVTDPEVGVNPAYTQEVAQGASPPKYAENPPSYEQLYGTQ